MVNLQSDCSLLFITKTYTGLIKFYDMEPNTLINALNEFIVIYRKILQNFTHYIYNFYNNHTAISYTVLNSDSGSVQLFSK